MDPLALQSSLHVGERADHGVDRRLPRCRRSAARRSVRVVRSSSSPCRWHGFLSSAEQPRNSADVASQCSSITAPRRGRPSPPSTAATTARAGRRSARCCAAAPGSPRSRSCSAACARVTASTSIGEPDSVAIARCSRESATRCAAASAASWTSRRRSGEPGPLVARRAVGSRPASAAPGSTTRRKVSASSSVAPPRDATVTPRATPGRGGIRHRRAAAPAAPASGRDQARVAQRAIASRSVVAAHAETLRELALRRQLLAVGRSTPRRIAPARAARPWSRTRCRSPAAARRPAAPCPRTSAPSPAIIQRRSRRATWCRDPPARPA